MLTTDKREQLDSIVSQMVVNKETDDTVQFVVNDFKNKYSVEEPEGTFLEKTANVLDTLFGGGKIGEAIGAGIAKVRAKPEEKEFIHAPSVGEVAGSALQSAALFTPVGTLAKGITAGVAGLGLKKGVSALGKIGAGVLAGEVFDIALNLQQGKTGKEALTPGLGAIIGGGIPAIGVGKNVVVRFGERRAPTVINSLVKPLLKDFSYGKDPGRAVAEEGIVANNFDDLIEKIRNTRLNVGKSLGELSQKLSTEPVIKISQDLNPLDKAIKIAAKQNNPTLANRLNSVKRAITEVLEPELDEVGNLTIVSRGSKDLENLTFKQVRSILTEIGDMTQFTGNISDDKLVNSALKQVYGGIKKTSLDFAKAVNPGLAQQFSKFTEKYADLHSAEIATKYRDKIVERQNLIGFSPRNIGIASGLITAVATGGATIPSVLVGLSVAVADELAGTPWFKTRLAYMLSKKSVQEANFLFRKIPALGRFFSTKDGIFPGDILLGEKGEVLERGIAEAISKPKIGLTIEDISKKKVSEFNGSLAQTLRGTKGLTAQDIMTKHPDIQLKRDVPATDIYGNKVKIPEGEALTPYELKGNKILLQDGDTYVVSKSQFQNIKGQSVSAEAKEFAPELKGLEESVRGGQIKDAPKVIPGDRASLEASNEYLRNVKTKFEQYQLPGGKNYKEILIKAPRDTAEYAGADRVYTKNEFVSSHWDEPNVISHLRLNEHTYKGKKVTFMEEAQSDWAKEYRKINNSPEAVKARAEMKELSNIKNKTPEQITRWDYLQDNFDFTKNETPFHPLVEGGKWVEPNVKRGLQEAVANDSKYFAWITGEQTSARYNLATHLDDVKWKTIDESGRKDINIKPRDRDGFMVSITKEGKIDYGRSGVPQDWADKNLNEVLGKGLADQIMSKESGTLSGEGLKFGGEWANNLYDKQIKNIVEDVTGGKVEKLDMGLPIEVKNTEFYFKNRPLKVSDLKVGTEISDLINASEQGRYIITDILGDGKFKAVPKSRTNPISAIQRMAGANRKIGESFSLVHERTVNNDTALTSGTLFGFFYVGDYLFIAYDD